MSVIDFLIVYLACGSPFAVYQATNREAEVRRYRIGRVFFALIFWPVLAFGLAKRRLTNTISSARDVKKLEELRNAIESRLFPDGSSSGVFEFRDAFYRYAGLEEASLEKPSNSLFEIFKVSGHPNAALASRILARKNLSKIADHKNRARDEFAEVVARNVSSDTSSELRNSIAQMSPSLRIPERSTAGASTVRV